MNITRYLNNIQPFVPFLIEINSKWQTLILISDDKEESYLTLQTLCN